MFMDLCMNNKFINYLTEDNIIYQEINNMSHQTNFFGLNEKDLKDLMNLLTNISISRLRNLQDAEDIVQTSIHKALKSKDTFKGGNLKGWFVSILNNSIKDFLNKGLMSKVLVTESGDSDFKKGDQVEYLEIKEINKKLLNESCAPARFERLKRFQETEFSEEVGVENQFSDESDLLKKKLEECFWALKEIDRQIMGFLQNEESYEFISQVTGLNRRNVAKRICEARKELKICIQSS